MKYFICGRFLQELPKDSINDPCNRQPWLLSHPFENDFIKFRKTVIFYLATQDPIYGATVNMFLHFEDRQANNWHKPVSLIDSSTMLLVALT